MAALRASLLGEVLGSAIAYSPLMAKTQRESARTVGMVGVARTGAPQRLAITRENSQKRQTGKAGVAGSNPAGGTLMK